MDLHSNKQYAWEQLVDLSIEFLIEYMHNNILPKLVVDFVEQSKEELSQERYMTELKKLKPFRHKVIIQTIYQWMKILEFWYVMRKKDIIRTVIRSLVWLISMVFFK